MATSTQMDKVYVHSMDVQEKEIEGLLIIIPLREGIPDKERHLALNDAGRAIWDAIDGKRTMREVLDVLADEFMSAPGEIERDVLSTLEEFLKRNMLIEAGST